LRQNPHDDVGAELESLFSLFWRILVNFRISPTVAGIAFVGVEHAEPTFVEDAESLSWFSVVFVRFGGPVRKVEVAMEETVREGELNELFVREYFTHLTADGCVQSVVVIDVEKPTIEEVCSEPAGFLGGKDYVAVTGEEEHGILEEGIAREVNSFKDRFNGDGGVLLDKAEQVYFCGGVVVPVSTTVVFKAGNLEGAFGGLSHKARSTEKESAEGDSNSFPH